MAPPSPQKRVAPAQPALERRLLRIYTRLAVCKDTAPPTVEDAAKTLLGKGR